MARITKKESVFEKIVKQVALDNEYMPFRIASRDVNGVPDMVLVGKHADSIYLELKTQTKLRYEQKLFSKLVNNYFVCIYNPDIDCRCEVLTDIEDAGSGVPLDIFLATQASMAHTWIDIKAHFQQMKLREAREAYAGELIEEMQESSIKTLDI